MRSVQFNGTKAIEFGDETTTCLLPIGNVIRRSVQTGDSTELLLWAQIVATREQTAAIRAFTEHVKQQTEDVKRRTEHLTPENLLGMVTEQFPDLLKSLNAAGVALGGDTGARRVVPSGPNGG